MSKTTTQDLNALSLADLTTIYNKYAAKPIKKFSCSRADAVAKVTAIMPTKANKTKSTGTKKLGIGRFVREQLESGVTPKDALAAVLQHFPEAKTTMGCIYWYVNDIKTNG